MIIKRITIDGWKYVCFVILAGLLVFSAVGVSAGAGGSQSQIGSYPIDPEVFTTRQRTIVPDLTPWGLDTIFPFQVSAYKSNGYGTWHYGPGLATEARLDLLPTDYKSASVTHAAKLLNFFTITDIHISDKESPSQAIFFGYKGGISSGYSPVMLYTTHVLDAAVQTVNAIHKQNPIDFGISLGDTCNDTQYNELRWYIDVLDGKNINPDSGAKDDPVPGPNNDYQDKYKAAGLDATIPWYQTLGNHDHFWIGSNPVDEYIHQVYTGEEILKLGNIFTDPDAINKREFYMGAVDGRTPYGDVIGVGPVKDFKEPQKVLAADPDRRSLTRKEWMTEFTKTSSKPAGHGFSKNNIDSGFASYSFEPKADMPIKMIALDDTQSEEDANYPDAPGFGHGSLDKARYEWLLNELDQGQKEGKLMIIAAHVPIGVEEDGSLTGWWAHAYVSQKDLIAKLHEYPNFILWIAGHRHVNVVTAFKSPDNAHPELGFWEIETSSLRDFPQQFRTIEIVRNSDNTISIFTTNIDPAVKEGSLAAISRSYGTAAQQLFKNALPYLPSASYNAELIKQLTPEMQTKIQKYGTALQSSGTSIQGSGSPLSK